ncbi:MAG TPA: endonuclease III [Acidimicrobiia bacterium]|nr:endonuclease III [Acidimicrobiia bacterium]
MARPRGARARAPQVAAMLRAQYPDVRCALEHSDAYQLLAATILSAQCTDERVNMVTPTLFARYPTPADLAAANPDEVEEIIRSTGFFRAKTRSLLGMAAALEERFGGEVPRDLDDLVTVPGVGRKTGNVVRSVAFGLPGLPVDTHVARLARRLGLTRETDPVKIESDLTAMIDPEEWGDFSLRLIEHGRRVCDARRPRCDECVLAVICPSAGTVVAPRRVASRAQSGAASSSRATRSKDRRTARSARSAE